MIGELSRSCLYEMNLVDVIMTMSRDWELMEHGMAPGMVGGMTHDA